MPFKPGRFTRRGVRALLIIAILAVLCAGVSSCKSKSPRKPVKRLETGKPNIIMILADDLGYGDLGSYGQEKIKTPALDQMAAEGMRFTDCYAGSSVCSPSRYSLMTGYHTGHGYIRANSPAVPLRPEDLTVSEVLKQAGYATAMIGKWGLGDANSSGSPNSKGFDYSYGFLGTLEAHEYYRSFCGRTTTRFRC